jgi:hypothetical protein
MPRQSDWTFEDGRANSSQEYLRIVDIVASLLRNIRIGDDPVSAARRIVSQLAHKQHMRPEPREDDHE